METVRWNMGLGVVILLIASAGLAPATGYPPANHGGADLILSSGDVIWGSHTNIGRFVIPSSATVSVIAYTGTGGTPAPGVATPANASLNAPASTDIPDVTIGPPDALAQTIDVGSGWLEVHAGEIVVSGTLTAVGSGHWGGAGGGGGGGASIYGFTGALMPGHGGFGGSGWGIVGSGGTGADGRGAFGNGAAGGDGGAGGFGGGVAGGIGSIGGWAVYSGPGGSGSPGSPGGYRVPGGNGDISVDQNVMMGSGGGGGGGAAGGGGGLPGPVGKIVGGGGGSGAAGAGGGGAIKMFATVSLQVAGTIDTRGSGGGPAGNLGTDGIITLFSAIGGGGASGANASVVPGFGSGGLGGHGLADRAIGDGYNGGTGGASGVGGGGGILLLCASPDGMNLTGSVLDARGGSGSTNNGGTVKIFFEGTDPTTSTLTILAGRLFKAGTGVILSSRHWELYK